MQNVIIWYGPSHEVDSAVNPDNILMLYHTSEHTCSYVLVRALKVLLDLSCKPGRVEFRRGAATCCPPLQGQGPSGLVISLRSSAVVFINNSWQVLPRRKLRLVQSALAQELH